MPVIESPVITLRRVKVICDRCGRLKAVDLESDAPEVDVVGTIGWQMVRHPRPELEGENLYFDTRSCMSAWYGQFVRVLYGGPADLPPRRSKKSVPVKVSPLRRKKDTDELPTPTPDPI